MAGELIPSGSPESISAQSAMLAKTLGVMAERASAAQVKVTLVNNTFNETAQAAAKVNSAATHSVQNLSNLEKSMNRAANASAAMNTKINAFITGMAGMMSFRAMQGLAGSSSPNGMASVDKAFSILSGTIGSLLLPGFVAAGGAAMIFADRVQSWVDKNFDSIVDNWADAIEKATNAAKDFGDFLGNFSPKRKGLLFNPGGFNAGPQPNPFPGMGPNGMPANPFPNANPIDLIRGMGIGAWDFADVPGNQLGNALNGAGGGGGGNDLLRELARNMAMIGKDMQMAMGPGSSINDPASRWREVALQVNKSELEMKQMEMWQKALNLVQRIAENLDKRGGGNVVGPQINGRIRGR